MAILNLTPDSFSDGGLYCSSEAAVRHARQVEREGADLLDIGAESTRPGAVQVSVEEEWERLAPVLKVLQEDYVLPISVDTRHGEVARRALEFPIEIINDVSCAQDRNLLRAVAESGAAYVLMHSRGEPATMMERALYQDVVDEIKNELQAGLRRALDAGIVRDKICLDPGFGFAKTPEQNWILFERIESILELGFPLMVGISRKRMLRERFGDNFEILDSASAKLAAEAVKRGAQVLRVHQVALTRISLDSGPRSR
ncbi:MAG TPA: dihydropteroate synthase [Deltaproteobacteria bacterium]|nr:dihydropteroate synthase [Deltaproteobacteria bacterium]